MSATTMKRRPLPRLRRQARFRLDLEFLEGRQLLNSSSWPGLLNPVSAVDPDNTLPLAQILGDLNDLVTHPLHRAEVVGNIGQGATGAADVDWFQFTLSSPSTITLGTLDQAAGSAFVSTLSLYTVDTDPNDLVNDPYAQFGYRLLVQADGANQGGDATITRNLGAGTYYVAVSGSGNASFNPYVADSGLDGSTGAYGLLITAASLGISPGDGPVVLSSDPAANDTMDHSPLVLRVDFSSALDPATLTLWTDPTSPSDPNNTVHLYYWAPGQLGQGPGTEVAFAAFEPTPPFSPYYFTTLGNELQLIPGQRLQPGTYQLVFSGDQSLHPAAVLTDLSGLPLGGTAANPTGSDFTATFQIVGLEGNTTPGAQPDDTYATAHDLGDLTNAGLQQVPGTIGDDPWYDFNSLDPTGIQCNPSNDVDLYHFTVSGPGNYLLTAETFAGRIGSPVLPQNTLYRVTTDNLGNKVYTVVGSNAGSLNATQYTDASGDLVLPFASDSVLYAGLQAGEYILAVSTVGNQPDLTQPSHSWQNGNFTTGNYVLNLFLQPDNVQPQVTAVSIASGTTLSGPLTTFTVQFNTFVNLPDGSVYVVGSDSQPYPARLLAYDAATNTGTFLMLDGLPVGPSVLHVSGANGVTDLFGTPLTVSSTGDYLVPFLVGGSVRGTGGVKPLVWEDQGPDNTTQNTAQGLGPLFPLELQAGVTIQRDFTTDPTSVSDTEDYYEFQLLQSTRVYGFNLTNLASNQVALINSQGHVFNNLDSIPPSLDPGTYWLRIRGLPTNQSSGSYSMQITLAQSNDNPPPLTAGAAPAVRVYLVAVSPPPNSSGGSGNGASGNGGSGSSGGSGSPSSLVVGPTGNPTNPTPISTTNPAPVLVQVPLGTTTTMTPTSSSPVSLNATDTIVPALLRLVTGEGSLFAGLPSGSLSAFSTGPLGGVRDTSATGVSATLPRLVGPEAGDLYTEATLNPVGLVTDRFFLASDDADSLINWEPLLRGYRRLLESLWRTSIEELPADEDDEVSTPLDQEVLADPLAMPAGASSETEARAEVRAFAPSDETWHSLTASQLLLPSLFLMGALIAKGRDDQHGPQVGVGVQDGEKELL